MMNQMGGQSQFSDEDLRKLAILLQQMPANEGLASVTQNETQLMKDYGGSGTPLPGTEGLGPDGGLVQSFQPPGGGATSEGSGRDVGGGSTSGGSRGGDYGQSGGASTGGHGSHEGAAQPGYTGTQHPQGPGPQGFTTGDSSITGTGPGPGASGGGQPFFDPHQLGLVEDEGELQETFGGGTITHPDGTVESGGVIIHPDGTVESAGDGTGGTTTAATVAVAPPTYKDKNGNEYDSPDKANKANITIDANIAIIEGLDLTTDENFKSWMLNNKDSYPVPPNSAASLEDAFNNAKLKATDAAAVELPKMVENMNIYLSKNGAAVPYDEWAKTYPKPANLSETTMRTMYAKAVFKAERKEAFTLTTEELESWMRPPVVIATADNFEEWWEGKKGQFKDGTFDDRAFAEEAHASAIIGDAKKVTVGSVSEATAPTLGTIDAADTVTVGTTGDVSDTTVDAIQAVTDADMDVIFAGGEGEDATGIDTAEALLIKRVEGTAVSPAEVQLKRSVENNLRMLLGATVGADVDPAKVRQLRNIWADMTQEVTGKAAEIRSQESMAAEKELVALYQGKSTMKLQVRLANLEVEKQTAFKNGELELAGKLANQQTRLTEVITQANIDKSLSEADLKSRTDAMIAQGTMDQATTLANLQAKKDIAIAQGKADVALSVANLQKNILLAQTNVEVAVKQRAMDDALAMVAYKGEMALMGLEVEIDVEEMKTDLTKMGFELTRDLAELDAATQIEVARLVGEYKAAINRSNRDTQREASILTAIGTAIAAYAAFSSDIRAKTNISPGSGEVESFLDALNSYKYEYKDPNAPGSDAGMFVGVMAQDLEKTPMGASFVQDTPRGKMVDYGHGLAAILASQANIHDRLKHLEEG